MDGAQSSSSHSPTAKPTSDALRMHQQLDRLRTSQHVGEPTATAPCWCLCRNAAGMLSQTSGLARAVGLDFEFKFTRLKFPWLCLPEAILPAANFVLRDSASFETETPPKLAISCGRHGTIAALALKKKFGDRVFTVHIQDPNMDPARFDLVVSPKHDRLRGPNVYLSMGAMHYVDDERLAAARKSPEAALFANDGRPLVAVLLGGQNNYYGFTKADVEAFIQRLKGFEAAGVRLAFLKSRRTSAEAYQRLLEEFGERHFVWDGSGANPYFAALALADAVVVTCDSVSMITEASATGRPVFVEYMQEQRRARRFRQLHELFEQAGITRRFDGRLADWTYEIPHDTQRVAQMIRERIGSL